MRFLTTLLPLITLAVHVAATNDLILLHDLPPPTYPEAVHLHQGHDHIEPLPYTDTEAPGNNDSILPAAQPPVRSIPPDCENALRRQAYAAAIQLDPVHRSRLEVVVDYAKTLPLKHGFTYLMCGSVLVASALVVVAVYDPSSCHPGSPGAMNCTSSHRRNLDETFETQKCERWYIEACTRSTSLTAKPSQSVASNVSKVASGGPRKRDAARMSYRRRLELV